MISKFIARILGASRFPPPVGQDLPDPGVLDESLDVPVSLSDRAAALGLPVVAKPNPVQLPKEQP